MRLIQTILALSILIVIHEFGHFFFSKIFGIRVDKFFLFFDAGGKKLLSTKTGWFSRIFPKGKSLETEYGIGWLPLGGYCKIAGMVDESLDTEQLKREPQPWEFRTKPGWQRLLVMAGGVLFNLIIAVIIQIGIMIGWGEIFMSNEGKQIYVNELSYDMGFRTGDHIISFDDYIPEDFFMLQIDMVRQSASKATVLRGDDTLNIYIDQRRIGEVLNTPGMFSLAWPFIIDNISEGSLNKDSGLISGDRIVNIDGVEINYLKDAQPLLAEHKGETLKTLVVRGADTLAMDLKVDSAGFFGVSLKLYEYIRKHNLASAIPAGLRSTVKSVGDYIKDLKLIFTPSTEAYKSVGSVIAIGQIFPKVWDWYAFLEILFMLSITLAVMNLLPIPALDGGHIVLTLYEMITGKKPSDNFLYITQLIGLFIIMGLTLLAFGNDLNRIFF